MGRRAKNKQSDPLPVLEPASYSEPSSKKLGKRKLNQVAEPLSASKKQRTKGKASEPAKTKSSKKNKQRADNSDDTGDSAWEDVEDDEPTLLGATSFVGPIFECSYHH
jgi:hypothetical protein